MPVRHRKQAQAPAFESPDANRWVTVIYRCRKGHVQYVRQVRGIESGLPSVMCLADNCTLWATPRYA